MMRVIGYIVAACIAIAAFKLAIVVGAIVLAIMFLFSIITRPAETFTWMLGFTVLGMMNAYPLAGLIVIGLLLAAWLADKINQ
ncbi:hypothetical protein [Croceicoccus marinus]|uniref:Uncharacterized protein n=1 Tax=Croceicoccus marinus TaxID=450378 RepID=A0A1Z1FCU6_9SPHN|nr:hypothetical protein [Croceicoccus marinus]ARU16574.1 hypothetical protein A9D14_10755 [Croceicoccus marinus]